MCTRKMAPAIIARFGGIRPMARALSARGREFPVTTVQSWNDSGWIPSRRLCEVLAAGQVLDPPLRPEEFFVGDVQSAE